MLARITSGAVQGVEGYDVDLEIHLGHGLVSWQMAGLPDGAVREAKMRVRSALDQGGFDWPQRPITVNLAPADIRKDGTAFDLPMALGLLAADGRLPTDATDRLLADALVVGELSLSGEVRPVRGVLPLAILARSRGLRRVIVPQENAAEATLVEGLEVLPVARLDEVVALARGERAIAAAVRVEPDDRARPDTLDLYDVCGQAHARRALEVAAAGGHNLLLCGPPGSGKTMLARRLPSILPALSFEEALSVTAVYSVAGLLPSEGLMTRRPFRAPHHTISDVGMVGGGSYAPRPGEVSLAHHGVLFLDELPEFKKGSLEVLRQPLEDQVVSITRRQQTVRYPAQVMLVAAMNGCPCGNTGSVHRACVCRPDQIERYRGRLSGPLLDRIDLQVEVCDVRYAELREQAQGERSSAVRQRVEAARAWQRERLAGSGLFCNAQLRPAELRRFCAVDDAGHRLLQRVVDHLGMSARAHDRILKVARTIADLAGAPRVLPEHLAEAIAYRCLDRAAS